MESERLFMTQPQKFLNVTYATFNWSGKSLKQAQIQEEHSIPPNDGGTAKSYERICKMEDIIVALF